MTATDLLAVPEPGQLVSVRDRQWVVSDVSRGAIAADVLTASPDGAEHLLSLVSIEEDAAGEELQVIWELEPGRRVIDRAALPVPDPDHVDPPGRLDAFLDAVRWGAIASADTRYLQAPFRSGIAIEDYQLDPVVRALRMPRVNLLVADDVGHGKNPFVLLTEFADTADYLGQVCQEEGWDSAVLTGRTEPSYRDFIVQARPSSRTLIISTRAGLQGQRVKAGTAIHYDLPQAPEGLLQRVVSVQLPDSTGRTEHLFLVDEESGTRQRFPQLIRDAIDLDLS